MPAQPIATVASLGIGGFAYSPESFETGSSAGTLSQPPSRDSYAAADAMEAENTRLRQQLQQQQTPRKRGKATLEPGETFEDWLKSDESLGTLSFMPLTLLGSLTYPSLDSLWQATIPRRRLHTQRRSEKLTIWISITSARPIQ